MILKKGPTCTVVGTKEEENNTHTEEKKCCKREKGDGGGGEGRIAALYCLQNHTHTHRNK
jgi:hypothetical protein